MKAKQEVERLQRKIESGDIPENEPLFVLRARDKTAAGMVRVWACIAQMMGTPESKVDEALDLADMMENWHIKQVPGRPETRTGA